MEKNSLTAKQFIKNHEGVWTMFDCSWKKLDKHHIVVYDNNNYEVHWKFINNEWRTQ